MNPGIGHENQHLYEFGPFRLDAGERVLMRGAEKVSLPPKAFDTLLVLIQNRGHVLSKEQLLETLWPDSFVEENNLTQQISALRKALGNNQSHSLKTANGEAATEEREFIETVPKLGYRFLPEVREVPEGNGELVYSRRIRTHIVVREEIEQEETEGTSVATFLRERSRKPLVLALVLSAFVVLPLAVYRFRAPVRTQPPTPTAGLHSLAVLPLRNLKPDPDTDFLSMALTDTIINRLADVGEIRVEPLSSVAKYRNSDLDSRQVARELKVQNVLAGSYLKEGDDLRVTLEFVGADEGVASRRELVDLKYEKVMAVQDRVAVSVIHAMGLKLQPQEVERLNKGTPSNPAAYEYYLRAIDEGFKANYGGEAKLLEKSVALEPGNAMAWTELGSASLAYSAIQGGDPSYADKGWQAFHRALNLDPTNRFIVDLMAFHLIEHNKAAQAVPLLRESLRRNPTDSFAHWYLSEAYRYGGALGQSVAEGELALKLNPNLISPFNSYLYVGSYRKFLDTLPHEEDNARTIFYRGLAEYSQGDTRSAVKEFDHALALNPSLLHAQIGSAMANAVRHENTKGLESMRRIEHSGGDDGEMLYKMAQAYAQLGDKQSALRLLRKSIELNFYPYDYFARDPLLVPIHGERDYSGVMELARQRQIEFGTKLASAR